MQCDGVHLSARHCWMHQSNIPTVFLYASVTSMSWHVFDDWVVGDDDDDDDDDGDGVDDGGDGVDVRIDIKVVDCCVGAMISSQSQ